MHLRGKTLPVVRKWPALGIPRFSSSSGADTVRGRDLVGAALDGVANAAKGGNREALRLLKALHYGTVLVASLVPAMSGGGLPAALALLPAEPEPEKLADPAEGPIDAEAFAAWLAEHDITPQSRKSYTYQYNALVRHAAGRGMMRDLPDILDDYRRWAVRSDTSRTAFNRALAVCLAWVRGTKGLGKRHAVDLALGDLERFPEPKKPKEHYTPRELQDIMQRLPARIAAMPWFQTCHGMGAKELLYDGYRRSGAHGLRVTGEKNEYRDRAVPFTPPLLDTLGIQHLSGYHDWFRAVTRETGRRITPHTLRACYSRWLEDAGIPGRRIRIYMGHSIRTDTERYQNALVTRELSEDADKLRAWLDAELARVPANEERTPIVRDPGQGARRKARRTGGTTPVPA